MRLIGLVSGGKDSCYALMRCVAQGHTIAAIANLAPEDEPHTSTEAHPQEESAGASATVAPRVRDEEDSHCFQTIGHSVVVDVARAIGCAFYRGQLPRGGGSVCTALQYEPTEGDEVESLYQLVKRIQDDHPDVQAVCSGAILSTYQRLRVEHVCSRLGLVSLAPLWEKDQPTLLSEMVANGMNAVLVKVASMGLAHKHLGQSLGQLEAHLQRLGAEGVNVCGEGGEYETLTLDCPLFTSRIVLDETECIGDLHTDIAPVAVLRITRWHLEEKVGHNAVAACKAMQLTALPTSKREQDDLNLVVIVTPASEASSAAPTPLLFDSFPAASAACSSEPAFPSVNVVADHCYVATASAAQDGSESDVTARVSQVLQGVEASLSSHEFGLRDACSVQFFLSEMSSFGVANEQYKQHLSLKNAASRACVQLSTPAHASQAPIAADCVAVRGAHRDVLHVQSISDWAPCCIGPYSQASKVNNLIWLAGQIGLDPSSMSLPSDPRAQVILAFRHCAQVLHSVRSSLAHAVTGVVYWSAPFWSQHERLIRDALMPLCDKQLRLDSPSRLKLIHVVVGGLPRDAVVEVQLLAQPSTTALPIQVVERATETVASAAASSASYSCAANATLSPNMLASHWCTLTVLRPSPSESSAVDASLSQQRGPTADLVSAASLLVSSVLASLKESRLRWRHILVFRVYSTGGVCERDLRAALHQAMRERNLRVPAVSFLSVAAIAGLDTTSAPSAAGSTRSCFLAAHVLALSRQLADRGFNPMRIHSDDEDEEDENGGL